MLCSGHYDMLYKAQLQVHLVRPEVPIETRTEYTPSVGIPHNNLADLSALDSSLSVFTPAPPGASNEYGQQDSSNFFGIDQPMVYSMPHTIPVSKPPSDVPASPLTRSGRSDPFRMSLEMFRQQTHESRTYLPTEPFKK